MKYFDIEHWLNTTTTGTKIDLLEVYDFISYTQILDSEGKPATKDTVEFLISNLLIQYKRQGDIQIKGKTVINTRKPGAF